MKNPMPLSGGSRSEVVAAETTAGELVVVKAPYTIKEATTEAAALRTWAKSGATVTLKDYDSKHNVLILNYIRPGQPLKSTHPNATRIVGWILRELHKAPPTSYPFDRLNAGFQEAAEQAIADNARSTTLRGNAAAAAIGMRTLAAAERTVQMLERSLHRPVLLHGDLSNKNIISRNSDYVAIDPLPRIGDPCSDIANYATKQHAARILPVANDLGGMLSLDRTRVHRWVAIFATIQSCQANRGDQHQLDNLISNRLIEMLQ